MHSLKKQTIIPSILVFMPREPYQCHLFLTSYIKLKTHFREAEIFRSFQGNVFLHYMTILCTPKSYLIQSFILIF